MKKHCLTLPLRPVTGHVNSCDENQFAETWDTRPLHSEAAYMKMNIESTG